MNTFTRVSVVLAAVATLSATAGAQAPPAAPPAPTHHGLLGRLFHHPRPLPGQARPGGMAPMTGGIVGNKKTHVYHVPGDHGALPATQNRVYFPSVAQAEAAGYHRAGAGGGAHRPGTHRMPGHGLPRPGATAPGMTH